jgi:hypothetical protein
MQLRLERVSRRDLVYAATTENPQTARQQPLLRLGDTVAGVAIGIACRWTASFLVFRASEQDAR